MKIESIEDGVPTADTIRFSVGVALNGADYDRWLNLRDRLKKANRKAKLAVFARKAIQEMMTELEALLDEAEKGISE